MNSTTVRVGFCTTIILLLLFAIPVMAGQTSITIKSGTLEDVLDAYSKATGTKTVYLNELIEGKNSPGAQNASPGEALQQILQGTGLTFQMADNKTAVLKKKTPTEKEPIAEQEKNKTEKPTSQRARREMELKELTVSAQKIEEKVQDVPISMTVLNEFDIEDKKIECVKDIASYTSNFVLFDKSGDFYSPAIRGISQPISGAFSSSVSMIIDGVPIYNSEGFNSVLMDIERVEVLKGPQGTLYGKDTQAGAINIITKKPTNELKSKLKLELGSDNKREYSAIVSGPIVKDKFYFGIAAKHYEKDGFIKNTLLDRYKNDKEYDYGKLQFRYTPNEHLEIALISTKRKNDYGDIDLLYTSTPNKKETDTPTQGYDKSSILSNALKISYDMDNYHFESITSHREIKKDILQSWIFPPMYNFDFVRDNEYRRLAQEFRLSNKSNFFRNYSPISVSLPVKAI